MDLFDNTTSAVDGQPQYTVQQPTPVQTPATAPSAPLPPTPSPEDDAASIESYRRSKAGITRAQVPDLITTISKEEGVDPNETLALSQYENNYDPIRSSATGARGPMQVLRSTGLGYVTPEEFDTVEGQVRAGVRYYKSLRDQFGNPRQAYGAYLAGPGRVTRAIRQGQELPNFIDPTTGVHVSDYVNSIMAKLPGQQPSPEDDQAAADAKSIEDYRQQQQQAQQQQRRPGARPPITIPSGIPSEDPKFGGTPPIPVTDNFDPRRFLPKDKPAPPTMASQMIGRLEYKEKLKKAGQQIQQWQQEYDELANSDDNSQRAQQDLRALKTKIDAGATALVQHPERFVTLGDIDEQQKQQQADQQNAIKSARKSALADAIMSTPENRMDAYKKLASFGPLSDDERKQLGVSQSDWKSYLDSLGTGFAETGLGALGTLGRISDFAQPMGIVAALKGGEVPKGPLTEYADESLENVRAYGNLYNKENIGGHVLHSFGELAPQAVGAAVLAPETLAGRLAYWTGSTAALGFGKGEPAGQFLKEGAMAAPAVLGAEAFSALGQSIAPAVTKALGNTPEALWLGKQVPMITSVVGNPIMNGVLTRMQGGDKQAVTSSVVLAAILSGIGGLRDPSLPEYGRAAMENLRAADEAGDHSYFQGLAVRIAKLMEKGGASEEEAMSRGAMWADKVRRGGPAAINDVENMFADFEGRPRSPGADAGPLRTPIGDLPPSPENEALYKQAVQATQEFGTASPARLSSRLKIGADEANNFLDRMEQDGILHPPDANGIRRVVQPAGTSAPTETTAPTAPAGTTPPATAPTATIEQPTQFKMTLDQLLANPDPSRRVNQLYSDIERLGSIPGSGRLGAINRFMRHVQAIGASEADQAEIRAEIESRFPLRVPPEEGRIERGPHYQDRTTHTVNGVDRPVYGQNRVNELIKQGMKPQDAIWQERGEARQAGYDLLDQMKDGELLWDGDNYYELKDDHLVQLDKNGNTIKEHPIFVEEGGEEKISADALDIAAASERRPASERPGPTAPATQPTEGGQIDGVSIKPADHAILNQRLADPRSETNRLYDAISTSASPRDAIDAFDRHAQQLGVSDESRAAIRAELERRYVKPGTGAVQPDVQTGADVTDTTGGIIPSSGEGNEQPVTAGTTTVPHPANESTTIEDAVRGSDPRFANAVGQLLGGDFSDAAVSELHAAGIAAGVHPDTLAEFERELRTSGPRLAERPPSVGGSAPSGTETSPETRGEVQDPGQRLIPSRPPQTQPHYGNTTSIFIPGTNEEVPAQYGVYEQQDVHPSHDPHGFNPNPNYELKNDRQYDTNPAYQQEIKTNSQPDTFKTQVVINTTPTAETGPPIVDENGNVLGGNSRAMMLARLYGTGSDIYKQELIRQASHYGLDPEVIRKMKKPVLVREVTAKLDKQKLITQLNIVGTRSLTPGERATAESAGLPDETANFISDLLRSEGDDSTLNDILDSHGVTIVNRLIHDGVMQPQERNALFADGKLTPEAKIRVSRLLTARVFRDLDQYNKAPDYLRANVERIAAPMMKIASDPGWDITPETRNAIDLLTEARAAGVKQPASYRDPDQYEAAMQNFLGQQSFVRDPYTPQEIAIAKKLHGGVRKAVAPFNQYANDAAIALSPQGGGLFGVSTPEDAFQAAFGVPKAAAAGPEETTAPPPEQPPTKPPEGQKPGPKVGDQVTMTGDPMTVAKVETINGIRYELYQGPRSSFVKAVDTGKDNDIVSRKKYKDEGHAQNAARDYETMVNKARAEQSTEPEQKPPTKKPGPPPPGPPTAPSTKEKWATLPQAIADHFAIGRGFANIMDARQFAASHVGEKIEAGSPETKLVDEAVEQGAVIRARYIVQDRQGDPEKTLYSLVSLYKYQMPTLAARTSTSISQQAYSTPIPLAYVASQLAGVTYESKVYEPTAGNGALLIAASPEKIYANEINPDRAQALEEMLPGAHVTSMDALSHNPPYELVDTVLANPPFGTVKEGDIAKRFSPRPGYITTDIDHVIALKALDAMPDKGSAVLIVGSVNPIKDRLQGYQAQNKRGFHHVLYNEYNVVDHFTVSGELYKKQGAGWPVDVIVIRGRGKSQMALPSDVVPKELDEWSAVAAKLEKAKKLDEQYPIPLLDATGPTGEPTGGGGQGPQEPENDLGPVSGPPGQPDRTPGPRIKRPRPPGRRPDTGGRRPGGKPGDLGTRPDIEQPPAPKPPNATGGRPPGLAPAERPEGGEDVPGNRPGGVGGGGGRPQGGTGPLTKPPAGFGSGNSGVSQSAADQLRDKLNALKNKPAKSTIGGSVTAGGDDALYKAVAAGGVEIPDTRSRLIDTTGDFSEEIARTIAESKWMPAFATTLQYAVDQITKQLGRFDKRYLATDYKGFGLAPDWGGINIPGEQVYGDEYKNNIILMNPFACAEQVLWGIRRGEISAADGPKELAKILLDTIVHEIAHQEERSDGTPQFTRAWNRATRRTGPLLDNLKQVTRDLLERNNNETYNAIARWGVNLRPLYLGGKGVHLESGDQPATSKSRPAFGQVVAGGSTEQGAGPGENLPVRGKPSTARMASRSELRPGAPGEEKWKLWLALTAFYVEGGADFPEYSQYMLNDAGSEIQPYLKQLFADIEEIDIQPLLKELLGQQEEPTEAEPEPAPAPKPPRTPERINTEDTQVPYRPGSENNPIGTLVPINMASQVEKALTNLRERVGNIDTYVAEKLQYTPDELQKYFGAEQVDALALALDNMSRGSGFIIGDQTGVGKGRVVAGVIRYAMLQGQTPTFVTEKSALYKDIYRDLTDIGMPDTQLVPTNSGLKLFLDDDEKIALKTPPLVDHSKELRQMVKTGRLTYDQETGHVIATTYSQMQLLGGPDPERRHFLDHFSHDGIVIFDESHNAGGTGVKRDEHGAIIVDRAAFARRMARQAGGVFYSSATFAKRPDVMDLYFKTDMSMAVDDPVTLAPTIEAGGVPLQQAVSSMLAESGQYIRREKSFDGIKYNTRVVPVAKESAEGVSTAMRLINLFDKIKKDIVESGAIQAGGGTIVIGGTQATGDAGVNSTTFGSIMHNLVEQMLLSLKMDAAIKEALAALKRNEKPVITVANTMGAFIEQYAKDKGLSPGDAVDLDFGNLLQRYLDKSREIKIEDAFGNKLVRQLTDEELGARGLAAYNRAKTAIDDADWSNMPVSPIDYIKFKLTNAGYRVSEITGRDHTIEYRSDRDAVYRRRGTREKSPSGRNKILSDFNTGQLDALILNQSGATGLSIHANAKFKNKDGSPQQKRHMIIAQAERNIDTHMQMLGRINRTGQVVLPEYTQLVADIPAEKRPAAVLLKKMASLNANTTAARGSQLTATDITDFMNRYGDEVVAQVMSDNRDIHALLGNPLPEDDHGLPGAPGGLSAVDAARKVTGRIPLLPIAEQERIYTQIEDEYNELIARLEAMGENALEAKTLDLDARTVSSEEVFAGKNPDRPFGRGADAETVDVKRIGKPFTTDQVLGQLRKTLNLPEPDRDVSGEAAMFAIQVKGVEAAKELIKEQDPKFNQYRHEVLDEIEKPDVRDAQRVKLNNWEIDWKDRVNLVPVGATVKLTGSGIVTYGVVTKVEQRGKPVNPLAFGTWKVTIALADSSRQVVLPFSKIRTTPQNLGNGHFAIEPVDRAVVVNAEGVSYPQVIDAFDKSQAQAREQRTIITGNLLAGFGRFRRGRIVNYTDENGNIRQGILMARAFNLREALDREPVVFQDPAHIIEFLDKTRGQGLVKSGDGVMRIQRTSPGQFLFSVPSSRSKGGRYFEDADIIRAAGRDFVKSGNTMAVKVNTSTALDILQTLRSQNIGLETDAHKAEAREVTGQQRPGGRGPGGRSGQRGVIAPGLLGITQMGKAIDRAAKSLQKAGKFTREESRWFAAAFADMFTRNGQKLRYENELAFEAFIKAASSSAQVQAMMLDALPAIARASGMKIPDFITMLVDSRLRGVISRYENISDNVYVLDDDELVEAFRHNFGNILDNIAGKRDFSMNLREQAETLLADNDLEGLRDFIADHLYAASRMVNPILSDQEFKDRMNDPKFIAGLKIYKQFMEKPIAESHASNEGIFSDALGPLNTYYPLIAKDENGELVHKAGKVPSRRAPLQKPKNISNRFPTGLSEDYSNEAADLADRLRAVFKTNNIAAFYGILEEYGLVLPYKSGQPYSGYVLKDAGPYMKVVRAGKSVNVRARRVQVPEWLWKEIEPMVEGRVRGTNAFSKAFKILTGWALVGLVEPAIHSQNLLRTMMTSTPFIFKNPLQKTFGGMPLLKALDVVINIATNLPVLTKPFAAVGKIATTSTKSEKAMRNRQRLANAGALPEKTGAVTYSKTLAEQTGAKLMRPSLGTKGTRLKSIFTRTSLAPFLFGPAGFDTRARLALLDILDAIKANPTDAEIFDFVNNLGIYNRALESALGRFVKDYGIGPYYSAASARLRNGIRALSLQTDIPGTKRVGKPSDAGAVAGGGGAAGGGGGGPKAPGGAAYGQGGQGGGKKGPPPPDYTKLDAASHRIAQYLSGGIIGFLAIWALTHYAYRKKLPWQEERGVRLGEIALTPEDRQSDAAQALYGKGDSTAYVGLDWSGYAPNALHSLGIKGFFDTIHGGGNTGQGLEKGVADGINSFVQPVSGGPGIHLGFTAITGSELRLTGFRDVTGAPGIQLARATPKRPAGIQQFSSNLANGVLGVNSFIRNLSGVGGVGFETPADQEKTAQAKALRLALNLAAPGLIKGSADLDQQAIRFARQRQATDEDTTKPIRDKFIERLRSGEDWVKVSGEIDKAQEEGKLAAKDVREIFQKGGEKKITQDFKSLGPKAALDAFSNLSPEAQEKLLPQLGKKRAEAMRDLPNNTKRDLLIKEYDKMMDEVDERVQAKEKKASNF